MQEVLSWRAPIEKIVSTINENYAKFFKELGCVGEVQLDVPENEVGVFELTQIEPFENVATSRNNMQE